jgi:hypothetical protein
MSTTQERPRAAQPSTSLPNGSQTIMSSPPQKREHSFMDHDAYHEHINTDGSKHPEAEVSLKDSSTSHIQYGVYPHDLLNNFQDIDSIQPIIVALDWTAAYTAMREHAAAEINKHAAWGATRELLTDDSFEIIDSAHNVRLRYSITAIQPSDQSSADSISRTRRENDVSPYDGPAQRYGVYVDLYCDDPAKQTQHFIGGFNSLGEANHGMKSAAAAYVAKYSEVRLLENSVELIGSRGEVCMRYTLRRIPLNANEAVLRLPPPAIEDSAPLDQQDGEEEQWCTCRQPDDGTLMLQCENDGCPVQWYHVRCVGVSELPNEEEQWYCPLCVAA